MNVRLVPRSEVADIDAAGWDRLAEVAASPNPFYERWLLTAALRHLELDQEVFVVVAETDRLVCLFPICVKKTFLNIGYVELWRYPDCFLTDILIDRSAVQVDAVLRRVMKLTNAKFVVSGFHTDAGFAGDRSKNLCQSSRSRGSINHAMTWEQYLEDLPSKKRSEHRRVMKRLLGQEGVEHVVSSSGLDSYWLPLFAHLECCGWKGVDGNALANDVQVHDFYAEAFAAGESEGKILAHAILKDGEALAISISYVTRGVSYEIKTTFDEKYKTVYPGVVLELLKIRHVLDGGYARADSCAVPGNELVNRLWPERLTIFRSMYFDNTALGSIGALTCDVRLAWQRLARPQGRPVTR